MTWDEPRATERRSRWFPTFVVAVFALVLVADAVVLLFHDEYRRVVDGDAIEAVFTPAAGTGGDSYPIEVGLAVGDSVAGGDGSLAVRTTAAGFDVTRPGVLLIRFRVDHAGGFVGLDYAFSDRRAEARCRFALSRVASRYGVDLIGRRTITARKGLSGRFRHSLTDHVGWFELEIEVGAAAAEGGFTIGVPEVSWE